MPMLSVHGRDDRVVPSEQHPLGQAGGRRPAAAEAVRALGHDRAAQEFSRAVRDVVANN
ncbi:hypothetical protein ACQEVB_29710 [Pseudonocardia sp. CA-107938]|uniref:hypothetical protein n=1 Tax=Pseudonocardia sp. CA-107938 TaxID=3240021 RepID=UPI003D940014